MEKISKCPCASCGTHVEFDAGELALGEVRKGPCPSCGAEMWFFDNSPTERLPAGIRTNPQSKLKKTPGPMILWQSNACRGLIFCALVVVTLVFIVIFKPHKAFQPGVIIAKRPSGEVVAASSEPTVSSNRLANDVSSSTTSTLVESKPLTPFVANENMPADRKNQTATMLPNGKVLVVGGQGNGGNLNSAELYDPSTGAWKSTASMKSARVDHTATLLPDGQVLVVGGCSFDTTSSDIKKFAFTVLPTTELYDPASETWNTAGSLKVPRCQHTATLLKDGKVLVAGGISTDGTTSSAELFDPVTGKWNSTGSLLTKCASHTATLTTSGNVLVCGGETTLDDVVALSELYDPSTGIWTMTGQLNLPRKHHTATLLPNGMVLVAGGYGNAGESKSCSVAELYDSMAGKWMRTGAMDAEHFDCTATLLSSGHVLVAGGSDMYEHSVSTVEEYNPVTGSWTLNSPLTVARQHQTATMLPSGKILLAGGVGENNLNPSASPELYDPNRALEVKPAPVPATGVKSMQSQGIVPPVHANNSREVSYAGLHFGSSIEEFLSKFPNAVKGGDSEDSPYGVEGYIAKLPNDDAGVFKFLDGKLFNFVIYYGSQTQFKYGGWLNILRSLSSRYGPAVMHDTSHSWASDNYTIVLQREVQGHDDRAKMRAIAGLFYVKITYADTDLNAVLYRRKLEAGK